jgi:hypothetical protein
MFVSLAVYIGGSSYSSPDSAGSYRFSEIMFVLVITKSSNKYMQTAVLLRAWKLGEPKLTLHE